MEHRPGSASHTWLFSILCFPVNSCFFHISSQSISCTRSCAIKEGQKHQGQPPLLPSRPQNCSDLSIGSKWHIDVSLCCCLSFPTSKPRLLQRTMWKEFPGVAHGGAKALRSLEREMLLLAASSRYPFRREVIGESSDCWVWKIENVMRRESGGLVETGPRCGRGRAAWCIHKPPTIG